MGGGEGDRTVHSYAISRLAGFPYLTCSTPPDSLLAWLGVSPPWYFTVCCPMLPKVTVSFEVYLFDGLHSPLLCNSLTQRRYRAIVLGLELG